MKKFFTFLSIILFLSGCTPSFNFSVPDIVPAKQRMNADLKSLSIFYGRPNPEIPIVVTFTLPKEISTELKEKLTKEYPVIIPWGFALEDALTRLKLFDKSATKKVNLTVTILAIDVPIIAADVTTRVLAEYKLTDKTTDAIFYNDTVKSEATVPFSYSFFAYERGVESINNAVQKNISTFISNIQNFK
jgi:hypothetical protein